LDQFGSILNLAILFAGLCALVYSLVSIVQTRSFLRRCAGVTGEVIRLERSRSGGEFGYDYAPVFSFTAADGNTFTVTSDVSSSPPGFRVGDSVRVRYDPADPQNARIHSFFQTWGSAVIFGAIGVGFFGYSCKAFGLLDLVK
jgi:hypothetical protein